jgi:hypothetical protein
MKHAWWFVLVVGAGIACNSAETSSPSPAGDGKGTLVDFDGKKSRAPAEWKEEKVAGSLRFMQFRLPKVKDDKADAEVVIFKGIGGSAKDNIARWKGMFIAPEGKTLDEVAKISEMKVGGAGVHYLDVAGTYKYKERPFDPNSKEERREGSRMIGVVFDGEMNVYHIRMVGYGATIEHYKKGFDDWLQGFK